MALTIKRDDKLTSLFDKFATLPDDKKESEILDTVNQTATKKEQASKKKVEK
ncbi:SPJ_0845 family protein [Lapidilactobacillus bayanensis]|uniref:SPJ_0845 family protein n=1 Tax=Lapidilactobacillus bayanensis TaxID=2485998 RepID=UPI0013DD96F6|nr:SPJ_0845 family protein [Lapidilactobacillus bayanensis]